MFRFFTRFPFPIRAGGPHTHQPPSGNSQKTAKSAIPHLAGHALQPMPGSFPHAPRIPIRAISPYRHSLTMRPPRPASPAPQIRHPSVSANSLRRRRVSPPAASTHGVASRRVVGVDAVGARRPASSGPMVLEGRHQAGPKACACGADPRGTGAGRTRQKPADAASGQPDPQDE